jgi:DNA-binding FrmR family transcriptional regulator
MEEKMCPSCCSRKKNRSDEEYKALSNRLNRISGQVKGIQKMLDESAYCPDILIQVSAVTAALNAFSRELLSNHIRTCVANDILAGKEGAADELVDTLRKILKQAFEIG